MSTEWRYLAAFAAHFQRCGLRAGETVAVLSESQSRPVLVETARLWADLGFWRFNEEEVFEIHGVTGPDEYTTVVNNNTYTNVMARWNLRLAATLVRRIEAESPGAGRAAQIAQRRGPRRIQ